MKKTASNPARVILITGAPAAGKFTVGNLLSKKLNIPLFHNHIMIDLIKSLFPNEKMKTRIRVPLFFDILAFAAKQQHSLILTYAYAQNYTSGTGLNDVDFVKRVRKIAESNGGKFLSVHLTTSSHEILNRTVAPSRKKFHKMKDVAGMKKLLKEWDVTTPPPFKDCLIIDNTDLSAKKTAKLIVEHLK